MSESNDLDSEKAVTTTTVEADEQAPAQMTSKKTDQEIHEEFVELINALKHRSREVRGSLEETQYKMAASSTVPLTGEAARIIDQNASQFMRIYAVPNVSVLKPPVKNKSAPNVMHPIHKPHHVLVQEVEALTELVRKLATKSPEVKAQVLQLAQKSEVLSQMNMLRCDGVSEIPTCSRYVYQEQLPRQNEIGEAKSKQTASEAESANEVCSRKKRKRNKKINNNNNNSNGNGNNNNVKKCVETTTLQSELDSLRKYINQIVQDFLGQTELPTELQFNGNFDELDAHAKRLVNAGLGRIVEDDIRVNRKNNRQSFITMSTDREGLERDGIVLLPVARRYAFEGDTVRAFVMNSSAAIPTCEEKSKTQEKTITGGKESLSLADDEELLEENESQESDMDAADLETSLAVTSDNCPKAFVISVIKQTELRQIVGTISFVNPVKLCGNRLFYKLKPHDMRVPMAYVPHETCISHVTTENSTDICGLLYLAHILETDPNGHCIAELLQPVGRVGNLEAEIKAILLHNGLRDIMPYEQRFNNMFADPNLLIDEDILKQRRDLRNECVFTIDPLTARDLDDALSVELVGNDETGKNPIYEVGVHISDVAFYLQENSELDNIVKERSTSIYLVNEVIHMLPQTLCFKCSLLPSKDKFAFSVFWTMNAMGEILDKPRFTRTIINSCTQFAYEHAQKIIDNPNENFTMHDFPTISNGYGPADIAQRVKLLHGMALEMRRRRYEKGALSINNPKLRFSMDPVSGEPLAFEVEKLREANHMIEEFMLLANQAVANFIFDTFPDIAILRNHAPPLSKSMKALREKLGVIGFELDYSSSKAIQESMRNMCNNAHDPVAMDACLSQLLMKPMARAKYFCSDGKAERADLWHYALSIPVYTHFTSPIRRYPDILVHRLLAAALNYCPPPKRTVDELHNLTKIANDRKYNAKLAGDESVNLFFKRYVAAKQSVQVRGVVIEIFQHMLNIVTLETGHVIGINYKMQKVLVNTSNVPNCVLISERNSNQKPLELKLLSTVDIRLVVWDNKLCGFFASPDPMQRQLNSKESSKKKQQTQQQLQQLKTNQPQKGIQHDNVTMRSSISDSSKTNCNNSAKKTTATTKTFFTKKKGNKPQSKSEMHTKITTATITQQHLAGPLGQQMQHRVFALRQNSL